MKFSRRTLVSIIFIASLLLFGVLFWPFILQEIIFPVALVVWFLLRLFVLSIDQHYYWGAIIFIAFVIVYTLIPQNPPAPSQPADDSLDANETIETIRYWRSLFNLPEFNAHDESVLKRELIRLVVTLYASKQRITPNYLFYEALERGETSLPEHIRTFLFQEKPKLRGWSLKRLLQFIREAPRKQIRRWKGQEAAEYYRMVDEIFSFMETSLEMENDGTKYTQNEH